MKISISNSSLLKCINSKVSILTGAYLKIVDFQNRPLSNVNLTTVALKDVIYRFPNGMAAHFKTAVFCTQN